MGYLSSFKIQTSYWEVRTERWKGQDYRRPKYHSYNLQILMVAVHFFQNLYHQGNREMTELDWCGGLWDGLSRYKTVNRKVDYTETTIIPAEIVSPSTYYQMGWNGNVIVL